MSKGVAGEAAEDKGEEDSTRRPVLERETKSLADNGNSRRKTRQEIEQSVFAIVTEKRLAHMQIQGNKKTCSRATENRSECAGKKKGRLKMFTKVQPFERR